MQRAVPVAVTKVWNGLPSDVITSASLLSVFKNRLKTILFRRCYETVWLWMTFPFPSHYLPSRTVVFARVFTVQATLKMSMMVMTIIQVTSRCWASFLGSHHNAAHICCWAQAPAANIDLAGTRRPHMPAPALSSKPPAYQCCYLTTGKTDGWTHDRYMNVYWTPYGRRQ